MNAAFHARITCEGLSVAHLSVSPKLRLQTHCLIQKHMIAARHVAEKKFLASLS